MAWIETRNLEDVEGFMRSVYEAQLGERGGTVSNIIQIHSLNEKVFRSFMAFSEFLFGPGALSRKTKEMIATVVSSHNDCHY